MKLTRSMIVGLTLAFLGGVTLANPFYWNPFGAATADFNTPGNWTPAGVPGAGDTARFTNYYAGGTINWSAPAVNSSAVFETAASVIEAKLTPNQPWTVTDAMDVGSSDALGNAKLVLTAGTLAVTNAAGTARLQVNWGTVGKGRLYLDGGTLIADHLDATNVLGSAGMDYIRRGTLITKGDSRLHRSGATVLHIGAFNGVRGEWKILGGTNTAQQQITLGSNIGGHSVCQGYVTVDGEDSQLNASAIQLSAGGAGHLTVTNGGTAVLGGNLTMGYFQGGNRVVVSGTGSVLNTKNQVWLYPRSDDNIVRVERGGLWLHNAANKLYCSSNTGGTFSNAWIVVDGPGSLLTGFEAMDIGGSGTAYKNGWGTILVSNGGTVSNASVGGQIVLGGGESGYGRLHVTGSGSALITKSAVVAGKAAIIPYGSTMLGSGDIDVTDGGLLQAGIYLGEDGTGRLRCDGGILQFTAADPAVVVKTPGMAVVTNGTISFWGFTGADVRGNRAGTRLTNFVFRGRNAFRLNQATNAASGQDYTFDNTGDPLNYVRLELAGGRYRGGRVTIGTDGALRFEGAGNLIDQVVTNRGTATLANATATVGAGLENFGRVEGQGTLSGSVTYHDGSTLAPGTDAAAGTLTLAGTHTLQPGVTVALDLNGTAPGQVDALVVAEGSLLDLSDADLEVTINCPVVIGDSFTIVDAAAGTLTGSFAVRDLTVIQDGKPRLLSVIQTEDAVRLVVAPLGSLFIVR